MMKLGLIGEKLGHSHSPRIHQNIMKSNHIEGTYDIIEIPKEDFERRFQILKQSEYHGLNVTIPYKETVIPLLDDISEQSKYIGAVNTICFENGRSKGYNTDYNGFLAILSKNGITVKSKSAILLGSGGVAKAVIKGLLDGGIYDMTIVSRSKQNFHSLYTVSYEFFKEQKLAADLLINCTPIGMYPNVKASPLSKELIRADIVIDMIYNPEKTLFLTYAEQLGAKTINGSLMLHEQAVEAQRIWNPHLDIK